MAVTALRIHDLGTSGAHFFWTFQLFLGGALATGLAILVGASAMVFLNTGMYARWFAWVSAALAGTPAYLDSAKKARA